jgi:hypothetical protein
VAFITGAVDAHNGSAVMAFLMGVFFVAALALYGMGLVLLDQRSGSDEAVASKI